MAIAFVQARREETQTGSRACQVDNNLTGSLLIAHYKGYAGNSTGISDDGAGAIGTWTMYHREANSNTAWRVMEVWTAPINTTGSRPTVTMTNAGADWLGVTIEELSGTDVSAAPISTSAFASGFSAPSWSAGTTGTPGSNEFARLVCHVDGGTLVTTPSAGYSEDTYTGYTYDNMGFANKTTSAAETPNYGAAGADEWNTYVIIVKNASAAVTREQEGYRFRADDGSETTATWLASQDTAITRDKNLNTRLRTLINVTSDAPSEAVKIQYRKVGAADWRELT